MTTFPRRRLTVLASAALALAAPLLLGTPGAATSQGPAVSPASEESPPATDEESDAETPEFPGLEPVDGGSSGEDATPVTAGSYVDVFPETPGDPEEQPELNIYQFERTIPESTIHFGVTLLDESNGPETRLRVAMIEPLGADDVRVCGNIVRQPELFPSSMPVTTYGGTSFVSTPACREAEVLRIGVFGPGERAPAAGTPYQLDVWEEPDVENRGDVFTPSKVTGGERFEPVAPEKVTAQVEPGATRPEATALPEPGGYHVDLPLGRVSWFAIEVTEPGQLLAAEAAVQDLSRVNQGAVLELRLVGSQGGMVAAPTVGSGGAFGVFDPTFGATGPIGLETARVQAQTEIVTPGALANVSPTTYTISSYPLIASAGWYYLAVYAQNLTGEEDATLPATLSTELLGSADDTFGDPPEYASTPEPLPGPESSAEPTEYDGAAAAQELEEQAAAEEAEAEEAATEPAAAEDAGVPWWVWVLGALVVVVIGVGAFLLARRGRSKQPQQGPGPGPGGWGGPPGGPGGPGGPGWGQGPPGPGPGGPGWGPAGPGPAGPPWGQSPGQGAPTPQTAIRPGPHPRQSGEWQGRPGQPQGPPPQGPPPQGQPPEGQPQPPWQPGGPPRRPEPPSDDPR